MKKVRRILVIDGSRVVRATLTKHLKDDFVVIEEANGESAWQTLMLDANVDAVVSGIHPPKLDARDLLLRLRGSSIRRLREIPLMLIVSDVDNVIEREADRACGVAGFITKSMNKPAIVSALNALFDVARTEKRASAVPLASAEATPEVADRVLSNEAFNVYLSSLNLGRPHAEHVCTLVFGIDNRAELVDQFGKEVSFLIATRFANLLMSKVGPQDVIGHCHGERLAIVSRGVDLKQGQRFGKQVCKSLAAGQITIRGQKVKLTASAGVASTSDDAAADGGALFSLADLRLNQAGVCGGNTVAVEYKPLCPLHCQEKNVIRLIDSLNARQPAGGATHIGTLGLSLLPMLRLLNQELGLGLSLDDIERQLRQKALAESEYTDFSATVVAGRALSA